MQPMAADPAIFSTLRTVLTNYAKQVSVTVDTASEYTLVTKSPLTIPAAQRPALAFRLCASGQGTCERASDAPLHVPRAHREDSSGAKDENAREDLL